MHIATRSVRTALTSALFLLAVLALSPTAATAQVLLKPLPVSDNAETPPPLPPQEPPAPPVEVPPPLPTFFVAIAGEPVGPLSLAEIAERIRQGEVTPATLVWRSGMADWAPAAEVPLIAELFETAAVPPAADPPAAEPDPADPVAEFDPGAYLVGTWRNDDPLTFDEIGQVDGTVTLTYAEDGTMTGSGTLSAMIDGQGRVTFTLRISGLWTAEAVSDARFNLTLDSTVRMSAPTLGINETEQGVDTALMSVIDPNTMRDGDGVIWVR